MTPPLTVEELNRVLQREPKHPLYLTQLASLLGQQDQTAEALRAIETAIQQPECPALAHQIHGDLLRASGRSDEAAGAYSLAVRANPTQPEPLFRMGLALEESGVPQGAKQAFDQVLQREPEHEGAVLGIARLLGQAKQHPDSIRWIQQSPDNPKLRSLLASELLANGNFRGCMDCLNKSETDSLTASLRIRALTYDPQADAQTLYKATCERANNLYSEKPESAPLLDPNPARRLRIGFVSSRLNRHNSSIHLRNLIFHCDRGQFEIVLFSDTHRLDDFSTSLKKLADEWHDISRLNTEEAAESIRSKQIDLLVDLHEHSNDNRLQIFGHKPTPIQVHWYANAVTTGLKEIDYRISSAIADPEEADPFSAEKVIRLPNYYLYSPSSMTKATTPAKTIPAKQNGFITFGAIHHLAKYNDEVLAAWKAILDQLPTAHLLLGRNNFSAESTKASFLERLEKNGLPIDRIELEGDQQTIGSLEIFNRIDIVLDSWPYNSVASAADGLWMGVPHITLYGNRTAGRRAADQMTLIGHPEWIAKDTAEYVEKAVALANDMKLLKNIRSKLHDEFTASPMCDHAKTARDIFGAFRQIWQTACAPQ